MAYNSFKSVVALLSVFVTSAICNAGFDVIDVYPVSDAYPNETFWTMLTSLAPSGICKHYWRNTKHKITGN